MKVMMVEFSNFICFMVFNNYSSQRENNKHRKGSPGDKYAISLLTRKIIKNHRFDGN